MKNILHFLLVTVPLLSISCNRVVNHDAASVHEAGETNDHAHENEIEHSVIKLKKQDFAFTIHTGGRIMADSKDIVTVVARSSGIVRFGGRSLFPGVAVQRSQVLFDLSGEQLADGNTDLRMIQLKADLEKSRANYERAQSLINEKVITREHYLEVKNEYEKFLNEYNNLNSSFGSSGNRIHSPASGHIRELFVTEGQMVTTGQPLASILSEKNLVLHADLPPEHAKMLPSIESANFRTGYSQKLFRTSEMNGRRLPSSGSSTGNESFYVPIYFRIDNDPELIEGSFADVLLIGKPEPGILAVPNSSLMEEYGNHYVFVEDPDHGFIKRYIITGNTNGEFTEVVKGLEEDEIIVATGTYNIKLAQIKSTPHAHVHNH